MTHCPGAPVGNFRQRPFAEREAIRQAFRIAYEYVFFPLFLDSVLTALTLMDEFL